MVAFDEKDNEGVMSNIVTLHLKSDGSYGTGVGYPEIPPNHPVKSPSELESQSVMIGVLCGTLIVMAVVLWVGIWYFR